MVRGKQRHADDHLGHLSAVFLHVAHHGGHIFTAAEVGALASEFSEDPGSKDKGGVYTFGRGRMVKPFEDAAFSQPVGEIGEPVRTNYGYHVLKVLERTEAGTIAFEDVRANISAALFREAAERAAAEHVKALRDAARIEFVSEAVVSDPVQVPAP